MGYINRYDNGKVDQSRRCTEEEPANRFQCEGRGSKKPNHAVHCCYENMCNTRDKMHLTLPTVNPSTTHFSSKGTEI